MSEEAVFPKSIEGFGYKFNENGELRNIKSNEKFLFLVRPEDRSYNQRNYEALGEVIGEFIENELVDKYKLVRKIIPVGSEEDDNIAKSRIYLSDDAQECQTLLLLIQGSGVVRPGQWARQVIINESLELGTMFPYIREALELKWGIIIFNPNENYGSITKDDEVIYRPVPGSESSKDHCLYVWDKFVKNSKAEKILIVAHSYGGICTTYMIDAYDEEFKSRVKGIALTDSVHSSLMVPSNSEKWFSRNTFNWIKSSLPLDEPVNEANQYYGCRCFSAGHRKHEYTSGHAFESVFRYLQGRLKEKYNKEITNKENKTDGQSLVANNGSEAMEIVDESPKAALNTQTQNTSSVPFEKDIEESMEVDGAVSNMQTHETSPVPLEKDTTSTEKSMDESPEAVQIHSSVPDTSIESVDESPKAEINMQTPETSSVKDTTVTEVSISMQTQEINSISREKDTTTQLDSAMEIDDELSKTTVELVMNDNEESREKAIVENNTSENQVATTKNEVVTTENEVVTTENEVATTENEVATTENEVATTENEVATTENEVATTENEVATTENEVATTENEVVTTENEVVTTENEVLTTENEVLTTENEVVTTENADSTSSTS